MIRTPRGRHARPRWWQRRSTRVDHCPDVPPPHAPVVPPRPDYAPDAPTLTLRKVTP